MRILRFQKSKNYWFLLFTIVFFFGFGEEISWGQRLLGFDTPDYLIDSNIQNEFTLHNIELFNAHDKRGELKTGISKLLTINFLFNLFWLGFGILLPLISLFSKPIYALIQKIKFPVPEILLGLFFGINWISFRIIKSITLQHGKPETYYFAANEMFESGTSIIFLMIFISFWQNYRLDSNNIQ